MKKNIHPKYQQVLFVDSASGAKFVCGSSLQTEARQTFEGVEYPVVYLSISSASHPFFTGSKQLVDSEGRVEKFRKRFERKGANQQGEKGEQDQASTNQQSGEEKKDSEKKALKKVAVKGAKK